MDDAQILRAFHAWLEGYEPQLDDGDEEFTVSDMVAAFTAGANSLARNLLAKMPGVS